MRDRFGALPEEATALMHVARVRERARHLGARQVLYEEPTRTLRLLMPNQDEEFFYQATFPKILDRFPMVGQQNIRLLSEGKNLRLVIRLHAHDEPIDLLKEIEDIIGKLIPEDVLAQTELA